MRSCELRFSDLNLIMRSLGQVRVASMKLRMDKFSSLKAQLSLKASA